MVLILIRRAARTAVGLALVAGILAPAACGGGSPSPSGRQVVAAFYPLAEVARRVGGARVRVSDLTPAGAEPHDIELSPDQVDRIQGAAVVVYLGHGFQPAVERAVRRSHARQLDALAGLPLEAPASNEEHLDADPHVWLDPVLFSTVVADVAGLLEQVDPAGRDVYAANASLYRADLAALDGRYRAGLARCRRQEIVTSHAAFGYLARRYGLHQEAVVGLSPDAEPDPNHLAALADLVHRDGVTTIFTETLASPKFAQALARETGAHTAVLDPIEGLSSQARRRGDNYVTLMDANLAALHAALGCD